MSALFAALLGVVFGLGILISGMGNPAKVLNFFDVAGMWDPSLAFVMGGAVAVNVIGYRLAFKREKPAFDSAYRLPPTNGIDLPLVAGSALFGVGWGIAGFCPGAVIPTLGLGLAEPWIFFVSMVIGMASMRIYRARLSASSPFPKSMRS